MTSIFQRKGRRTMLIAAALLCPLVASALPINQIVVFGDSLADGGNNAILIDSGFTDPFIPPGTRTPTPIPSDDFFGFPPYASNRYSNGPVWVEHFANSLGLPLAPALLGGTNFAFGGATTGPIDPGFPGITTLPVSVATQVTAYLAFFPPPTLDTLFVINVGGNDVRAILEAADPMAAAPGAIANYVADMTGFVGSLWAAGARQFLISTVPDVGKTPAIAPFGPAVAGAATAISQAMGQALILGLSNLPDAILESSRIDILDLFAMQQALFANPAAFGMTDVTNGCAQNDPVCDPNTTFFWDGLHPTTAGHAIIARAALEIVSVPEPSTVALISLGLLAGAMRRRAIRIAG